MEANAGIAPDGLETNMRHCRDLLLPCSCLVVFLIFAGTGTSAAGPSEFGISVGLDLTQTNSYLGQYTTSAVGGSFDSARLAFGGYAVLGQIFVPQLKLVAGGDLVVEGDYRIFSANAEARYLFAKKGRGNGYCGGGLSLHFLRPTESGEGAPDSEVLFSLNLPLGFQKRLSAGMGWFGELRLVIAEEQTDSSLRLSVGLMFGPGG